MSSTRLSVRGLFSAAHPRRALPLFLAMAILSLALSACLAGFFGAGGGALSAASDYAKGQTLYDFRLDASAGFPADAVTEIEANAAVRFAEGCIATTATLAAGGESTEMTVRSNTALLSRVALKSGCMPVGAGEILLDAAYHDATVIGTTFTVVQAGQKLETSSFVVVGIADFPESFLHKGEETAIVSRSAFPAAAPMNRIYVALTSGALYTSAYDRRLAAFAPTAAAFCTRIGAAYGEQQRREQSTALMNERLEYNMDVAECETRRVNLEKQYALDTAALESAETELRADIAQLEQRYNPAQQESMLRTYRQQLADLQQDFARTEQDGGSAAVLEVLETNIRNKEEAIAETEELLEAYAVLRDSLAVALQLNEQQRAEVDTRYTVNVNALGTESLAARGEDLARREQEFAALPEVEASALAANATAGYRSFRTSARRGARIGFWCSFAALLLLGALPFVILRRPGLRDGEEWLPFTLLACAPASLLGSILGTFLVPLLYWKTLPGVLSSHSFPLSADVVGWLLGWLLPVAAAALGTLLLPYVKRGAAEGN